MLRHLHNGGSSSSERFFLLWPSMDNLARQYLQCICAAPLRSYLPAGMLTAARRTACALREQPSKIPT